MNAALTLLRREYWEHRGRNLWLPVVIFGLWMLASLIIGIIVGGGFSDIHPSGAADSAGIAQLGFVIGFVFYILFALSSIGYCVSCLSEDRVDKSVLFWRSLPVSDRATVLSKVGAFALVGPAIIWLATILTHLLVLLAIACMASARGAAGFTVFTHWVPLLGTWALFAWAMLLNALWWLPYVGWLLVVSAIFRKRTMIWGVLLPIIVGFVQQGITYLVSSTHTATPYFFGFIIRHLTTAPVYFWGSPGINSADFGAQSPHSFLSSAGAITNFITLPSMWIGVGIGIGLIAFAIVTRRHTATA
ncbi:MAG: hypothetical protein ACRESR_00180 [Gammaproteobacteria bacterium]